VGMVEKLAFQLRSEVANLNSGSENKVCQFWYRNKQCKLLIPQPIC
jgi:hypothetical protein